MKHINVDEWEHNISTIKGLLTKLETQSMAELLEAASAQEITEADVETYQRLQHLTVWSLRSEVHENLDALIRVTQGRFSRP